MIQRLNTILERNEFYPTRTTQNVTENLDYQYLRNNQSKLKQTESTTIQKLYKKINEMSKNPNVRVIVFFIESAFFEALYRKSTKLIF